MAGIGPISGVSGISSSLPTQPASKPEPNKDAGFGDVLKAYVDNVDSRQKASAQAMQNLVTGKTSDVLPAVTAAAKADLSFKLLIGVRNKVIEAYKETMRMQV
jgi:flagellar hook-basal body complex protein FliE